ncbi:MAG: MBL fold metallo-hydrolase [Oscillatoria sp. PMC 1051.18]|nr:MBL fold metallo-hydrolase [Oscillatoria sp. PMC 1050.18]MEC5031571.1 MBL fold metallo-hydrolase [Oscillatoria sp. PMC 1051.18]
MKQKVTFFQAGYCTHPEAIVIKGGRWENKVFPSLFALIQHPRMGDILFDTGYSSRFFDETRSFPFRFYALTTPVYFQPADSAVSQLRKYGIPAEAIQYIIISHFHADHVGGLRDFPDAKFICFHSAYEAVKMLRGLGAVKAGYLSGLLPDDFEERTDFLSANQDDLHLNYNCELVSLPTAYAPFETGFDLFGDGSILAVELPGHVMGQLGIFLTDADEQTYFLVADACWLRRAYQELVTPHPLANLIFSDRRAYANTLQKIHRLHQLNPLIKIVPTHCQETWKMLNAKVST